MNHHRSLFARTTIAKALARFSQSMDPAGEAAKLWGSSDPSVRLLKAAVVAGGSSNDAAGLVNESEETAEFLALVRELELLGRIPGIVYVGPTQPFVGLLSRTTGSWVGEGRAIPASALSASRETLRALKVAAQAVLSRETVQDGSPRTIGAVGGLIANGAQEAVDAAFIDSSNAGVAGVRPKAITYDALSFTSHGSLDADLHGAASAYAGNWSTAAWILNPADAASIALVSGSVGFGATLGPKGGELLGVLALCSEGVPRGQITLLDGAAIAAIDEGASLTMSDEALIEMDSAPQGDSLTPTAASASLTSLWQQDLLAQKVVRRVNWATANPGDGRIVVVKDVDYLAS